MKGLTSNEARRLLKEHGPNMVLSRKRRSIFGLLVLPFRSPLVAVLVISAILADSFGEKASALIIIAIVITSALLDFLNSYKSDRAAEKLQQEVRITTTVLRDGHAVNLPIEDLVPGDVVVLTAGDIVPADGKVLEASHCYTNESSLTGEAFPQPKQEKAPLYMGSSIATGEAKMLVTKTGTDTHFSRVVTELAQQEVPTEFDREIRDFSMLVLRITLVLVAFVFVANSFRHHDILGSLLFAVALAVGITPELLPLIITLNLTKGSLAMAKHGVIVKKLSAIQNFGSMDVLCTDKTGTLTEDEISLVQYVNGEGKPCETTLKYGYLNSVLSTSFKNPLDEAIRGFRNLGITNYEKIDELPFDFERRRESIVVDHAGKRLLIAKGSTEGILAICDQCKVPDSKTCHTWVGEVRRIHDRLSKGGFRVLAIATREIGKKDHYENSDEKDMTFQGFLAFLDPAKTSVTNTLERMKEYGIQIKVVTGDNELVTARIAQDINLEITGIVLGSHIEIMDEATLSRAVEEANIFARVNPEQKLRIIRTIQANKHVVGYLGDGINDAPSLKAADIGISVNNATDIAKESADLILLHKSLRVLVEGVIEGRRTFANTLKYLRMVLSSNFGNVLSMAGASLFLPYLPMLPAQVLFNNLLYDTTQFAIPFDNVDAEDVRTPRTLDLKEVRRFMLTFGPLSSLFDFMTFGLLYWVFNLSAAGFQTGWFLESLATQTLVVLIIRTGKIPFLQSMPSRVLLIGTLSGLVIGWFVGLSHAGDLFGFTQIASAPLMAITATAVMYLCVVEVVKRRIIAK